MSAVIRNQVFSAVHTIGGLLPADMLVRISEGKDVSGSKPSDYRVIGARSVSDEAERHWDYLKSVWAELRTKLPVAPESAVAPDHTGLAVTQWLLPLFAELGFGELTTVGTSGIASDDGSKTFPISHRWNHVPIHFAAWDHGLDKRPGGAGTTPPQSLVQECLNRTESQLWAVVTNGRQLRLLRDSSALATASYVEFDLEAIFDGELFSEFLLLYRLLHVSRFAIAEEASPATCWLETWRTDAITSGTRALDQLRDGVRNAITTLGTGFLQHPDNAQLRSNVDVTALHQALLRLVYRLLFVFVAEDRDVLHPPAPTDAEEKKRHELARRRYEEYFSSARLRRIARRRRGTAHGDLYRSLRLVLDALGDEAGRPELGLPGIGGIFDETEADAVLHGLSLTNEALLAAVRHLAQVRDVASRRIRAVDYQHLGAEELGSVYESLLEYVPKHSPAERKFELVELAGNERKTTGSYYTPSSLIETLLDTTLDPVIDDAMKRGEQAASAAGEADPTEAITRELLSLTVCDPACGSGHFLVAAARRIAKRVAAVREHNPEPTLGAVRHALHEVIARCIYGVDLNPMAVELAKVSLWLEALEPGKPLSFLDAHVKCGNALIGATPALLRGGIPDEAFKPIEGDDKKFAKALEKQNKKEREGQFSLFDTDTAAKISNTVFASSLRRITTAPADNLTDVRRQESAYDDFTESPEYKRALQVADAWCAAFLWRKSPDAPRAVTADIFRDLQEPEVAAASQATHDEIARLRDQYRFFHWHLEFPDVFTVSDSGSGVDEVSGWSGGFSCVLGNPPWERIKLQEQEFFAQRDEVIATARNAAARKKLIAELKGDPDRKDLYVEFEVAKRKAEGESHFLRIGGRYPLTGRGDINTYAVFAETDRTLVGPHGRMGVIVPTGIATDATTQHFFRDLVVSRSLVAVLGFYDRKKIFTGADVHGFCLFAVAGRSQEVSAAEFSFFVQSIEDLGVPGVRYRLTPDEIMLLNPNTGTCPVFRSRRDAEITLGIYRRVPVLVKEPDEQGEGGSNPWGVSFMTMFHMSNDSHLFHTREALEADSWTLVGNVFTKGDDRMLPLYESKMLHYYDHRWGTYDKAGDIRDLDLDGKRDVNAVAIPRYWVSEDNVPTDRFDKKGDRIYEPGVEARLAGKRWDRDWLLGWRDICRATDERTAITGVFPRCGVGNNLPVSTIDADCRDAGGLLVGCLASFVLDFVARLKVGGVHLNFFISRQLPVLPPNVVYPHAKFINDRVRELAYTSRDMEPFARDLGDIGAPFRWDDERRTMIRAELDALFFHLYGISRDDADYILDTFPVVKRRDEAKYGTYRTKELILGEYDRMAAAGVSLDTPLVDGQNYTSTLTPPPGHGPRHPAREEV
ncbi:Type II restriction/modification system, DNA methylase subunit YeeA [Saccharopolyspora kobensis]|uniref:site-specific DNA-methyltransferase (adenine-specific) n=1 Tax=Saccharopolyspora kobensis TaxID=146035 RepID=A0A1H5SZY9_9PSEU|nr:DNA methyltransferase [Saccharopolyspora kobensis]SEF56153.1 Type II restriction/modification system, DNA methylase subunit YeeA [Saccharopolyspora kobensis]SFC51918.1 Type II restriction/modification system, DNA methylase subunit YeeA [Saccharopolyspora kobensis]